MKHSTKQPSRNTSKPLKIGLVCDTSLDAADGMQQYVITLGEWLRDRGHDVHYLTSATKRTDLPHLHVLSRHLRHKLNENRMTSPLPDSQVNVRVLTEGEQITIF